MSLEAMTIGSYPDNVSQDDIDPVNCTKHYALSLYLSGQTPAKICSVFSNNTATSSGTVKRVSYTTGYRISEFIIERCSCNKLLIKAKKSNTGAFLILYSIFTNFFLDI
jgi:hypothetical protein